MFVATPDAFARSTDELHAVRLPKAVYDPDTGETLCETRNAQAASTSDDPPCATTFGLFNGCVLPAAVCVILC